MGRTKNTSDEDIILAAGNSFSMNQTMNLLGYASSGANARNLWKRVKSLDIDTSHFVVGIGGNRTTAIPLEDILIENSSYGNNQRIVRLLVSAGIKKYACESEPCSIESKWLGQKIVLQLDHINGVRTDNRIENLRILCPNCHTQTDTYCRGTRPQPERICSCGNEMTIGAAMCRSCKDIKQNAIDYPPLDELETLLREHGSFAGVGRVLNVSGTQIRQRIQKMRRLEKTNG